LQLFYGIRAGGFQLIGKGLLPVDRGVNVGFGRVFSPFSKIPQTPT
jgi:hypothetical protein